MSSTYVTISRAEFEETLPPIAEEVDDGSGERVYGLPLPHDDLSIRVFSTIEGGESRGYGRDAIRCVVWSGRAGGPVGGRKKTLRTEGWGRRLRSKIESLYSQWRQHDHGACPACGRGVLVERRPSGGQDWDPFLACSEWDGGDGCEHTEALG
jgi:hypothetical protein